MGLLGSAAAAAAADTLISLICARLPVSPIHTRYMLKEIGAWVNDFERECVCACVCENVFVNPLLCVRSPSNIVIRGGGGKGFIIDHTLLSKVELHIINFCLSWLPWIYCIVANNNHKIHLNYVKYVLNFVYWNCELHFKCLCFNPREVNACKKCKKRSTSFVLNSCVSYNSYKLKTYVSINYVNSWWTWAWPSV